jgi:uncharacterized heparinase superfamily protein
MKFRALPLYLGAAVHLKPEQIAYRGWYALRTRIPGFFRRALPSCPDRLEWISTKSRISFPGYPWFDAGEISRGCFWFLNEPEELTSSIDWQVKSKSRLWRYNLHYFQYLLPREPLAPEVGLHLIRDWIERVPPGSPDAWDPFPISLRLVNWLKYLSCIALSEADQELIVRSLYQQAASLERSLEYHLLGNHLFKNAKALLFCGLSFTGPDATRWLSKGLLLLHRELGEQILPDGGHFERSPMYHTMILEDCLDLLNVCRCSSNPRIGGLSERLETVAHCMMRFLHGMTHPDGRIALFNDAALGIELDPDDLAAYCESLMEGPPPSPEPPLWSFPETGYYIMAPAIGDRLLIDCGAVGPDYQPGHSHCDALSFELSLKGRRVVVDSGCFQYEDGPIRRYNRGNMGHNTVTIDGRSQSEVWGAHRCARRARPLYARLGRGADGSLIFEGAHDGYKRLTGSPIHNRRVTWSGNIVTIEDHVEGSGTHEVESRLHIHPDFTVEANGDAVLVRDGSLMLALISSSGSGPVEKIHGWYCPEFGRNAPCTVLRVNLPRLKLPYMGKWVIKILD